jgi:hypothetical protein
MPRASGQSAAELRGWFPMQGYPAPMNALGKPAAIQASAIASVHALTGDDPRR